MVKVFLGGPVQTFGDVCLISTLVRNMKIKYGEDCQIDVVTGNIYANILQNNPDIHKILLTRPDNFYDIYVKSCFQLYDHIFLPLMTNHETTLWHHRPEVYPNMHLVDFYAKRCGNLTLHDRRTFIYPDEQDRAKVHEELGKIKHWVETDRVPVVMHIQSPVGSKSWGVANFSKLAQTLEKNNCIVIQVGGPNDERIKTPRLVDLRGKLTPRQSAMAMAYAFLYVGIDSGPAYLADAMNVPSIILYGATTHIQAGPLSAMSLPVEPKRQQKYPCGPGVLTCSTHCMINNPCINNHDRDEIAELVLNTLKNIVQKRYEMVQAQKAQQVEAEKVKEEVKV